MFDLPVVVHEEDPALVRGGVMNEGWVSTRLGLAGWPAAAEATMVARDVQIAALAGARLHVAHVSTRERLDAIRNARRKGVAVSCEATPHHLTLTDEEVARSGYDTRFKMNPPLRSEADRTRRSSRRSWTGRSTRSPRTTPRTTPTRRRWSSPTRRSG
jgi:dihydroorotase